MATNMDTSSYAAYNSSSPADTLRQKSALDQAKALKKPVAPKPVDPSMSAGVASSAPTYGDGHDMAQYGAGQPMPDVGSGTGSN